MCYCSVVAVLTVFGTTFYFRLVPEIPRWLIKHGRRADAARILRRMARLNGKDISSTVFDIAIDSVSVLIVTAAVYLCRPLILHWST